MSCITLKIDKGGSPLFSEIMSIAKCFTVVEHKAHYTVKISDEDAFRNQSQLQKIIKLLPVLKEKEWFNIPDYGTNAWADWMIDLHIHRKNNNLKK